MIVGTAADSSVAPGSALGPVSAGRRLTRVDALTDLALLVVSAVLGATMHMF
jgi:hypothetical protein